MVQIYYQIEKSDTYWIDILVRGRTLSWDAAYGDGRISYGEFKNLCASSINLIRNGGPIRRIITIDMELPFSKEPRNRSLQFYRKNDSVIIDLLLPLDRNNPYHIKKYVNISDQRLLDLGKWPLEVWADECFETGSMREILIPSIDENNEAPAGSQEIVSRPVGAKIYTGTINGAPACFYMKDSR